MNQIEDMLMRYGRIHIIDEEGTQQNLRVNFGFNGKLERYTLVCTRMCKLRASCGHDEVIEQTAGLSAGSVVEQS